MKRDKPSEFSGGEGRRGREMGYGGRKGGSGAGEENERVRIDKGQGRGGEKALIPLPLSLFPSPLSFPVAMSPPASQTDERGNEKHR